MYVSVRYFQTDLGAYAGGTYIYQTNLPLVYGDKVIAPTQKALRNKAIVMATGLEKPKFPCKEIVEYDYDEQ